MNSKQLSLLAAILATASVTVGAATSSTDAIRAEIARQNAAAEHAASLRPFGGPSPESVKVTDSDSARRAAELANARQAHEAHLMQVVRAGVGANPVPIKVFDTDTARAAAQQQGVQGALLSEYAEYAKVHAQAPSDTSAKD